MNAKVRANRTWRRILAVALLAGLSTLGLTVIACGGGDTEEADTDAAGGGEEQVFHLHAENVKFEPSVIRVKVGETVRLTLDNHDAFLHDYTVDEAEFVVLSAGGAEHMEHESTADDMPGVEEEGALVSLEPLHIATDAKEQAHLVFSATEPDEYEFYCSVPGHRELGMVGTLTVQ